MGVVLGEGVRGVLGIKGCSRGYKGETDALSVRGRRGEKGPFLPMKNLLCPSCGMGYV